MCNIVNALYVYTKFGDMALPHLVRAIRLCLSPACLYVLVYYLIILFLENRRGPQQGGYIVPRVSVGRGGGGTASEKGALQSHQQAAITHHRYG